MWPRHVVVDQPARRYETSACSAARSQSAFRPNAPPWTHPPSIQARPVERSSPTASKIGRASSASSSTLPAPAFGLVVNRKATAKGLPWPVFAGGPCPSPGLLMLHGHAEWAEKDPEGGEDSVRGVAHSLGANCITHVDRQAKQA